MLYTHSKIDQLIRDSNLKEKARDPVYSFRREKYSLQARFYEDVGTHANMDLDILLTHLY